MSKTLRLDTYTVPAVADDQVVQEAAVALFGGFTTFPGTGGWLAPDGETFLEPSATIVITTDIDTYDQHWDAWQELVLTVAATKGEQAVDFSTTLISGHTRFTAGR